MQLRIDSLTTANAMLTLRADSLSKQVAKYKGVYTAVKEKVVKYEFAPERTSEIIDSLAVGRQSAFTSAKTAQDSLAATKAENKVLKDKMAAMEAASVEHTKLTADLEELKRLLDSKILTQEEFDIRKQKILAKW
jgi:cell shape-determining protein MreC